MGLSAAPTPRMQFYAECTAGHLNAASVGVIYPSLERALIKTQEVPITKNSRGKKKEREGMKVSRQAVERREINRAEVKRRES